MSTWIVTLVVTTLDTQAGNATWIHEKVQALLDEDPYPYLTMNVDNVERRG